MQILLDTHYLIWLLTDDKELTKEDKEILTNEENEFFYSTASLWEIDIKHKKHPDIFPYTSKEISDACLESNIENLPIFNKHIFQLNNINKIENTPEHNDPFDMLLLAQAKRADMKLLSKDSKYNYYNEQCIMR